MPKPGDQCSTCFYAMTVPADASSDLVGKLSCNYNAPPARPLGGEWSWPIVSNDWWCGVGCNFITGADFDASTTPSTPTGAVTYGTFTAANQNSITVTDASCKATSLVKIWWISVTEGSSNPPLLPTPGAGSFVAATVGGASVTGTLGYSIQN